MLTLPSGLGLSGRGGSAGQEGSPWGVGRLAAVEAVKEKV